MFDLPTIFLIIVDCYVRFVLSFERWSVQTLFDAIEPNVVVHYYARSYISTRFGA